MNTDEKKHVQQYVGRAKLFIANINQRRQTMFGDNIASSSGSARNLIHGIRRQPLSRAHTSAGIHESTAVTRRAVASTLLPSWQVISMRLYA